MKNKFLKPEMDIIKLLTDDVVYTSGEDYIVNPYGQDEFGTGTNIPEAGELS